MAAPLDPYHDWLAIPPDQHPPDHYALLGIPQFEADVDAIADAADRRIAKVRGFASGPHAGLAHSLIHELAAAQACLGRPSSKAAYDAALRTRGSHWRPVARPVPRQVASAPMPEAAPPALPVVLERVEVSRRPRAWWLGRPRWLMLFLAGGMLAAVAIVEMGLLLSGIGRKATPDLTRGSAPSAELEMDAPQVSDKPAKAAKLEETAAATAVASAAADARPHEDATASPLSGLIESIREDSNPKEKAAAIANVAHLGTNALEAVPALTDSLQSEYPEVRSSAVDALGSIGPEAKAATANLAGLAKKDAEISIRDRAIRALMEIDPNGKELRDVLSEALAAGRGKVRIAVQPQDRESQQLALKIVSSMGSDGAWSIGLLNQLLVASAKKLDDPYHMAVFDTALKALRQIGAQDRALLKTLRAYSSGKHLHASRKADVKHAAAAAEATRRVLESGRRGANK